MLTMPSPDETGPPEILPPPRERWIRGFRYFVDPLVDPLIKPEQEPPAPENP